MIPITAKISGAAMVAMLQVRRQIDLCRRIAACSDGEFRVWVTMRTPSPEDE